MIETDATALREARRLIEASNMSFTALSSATGIHRATLLRWKNSDDHAPSGRALDKLRAVVGESPQPARPEAAAVLLHQMPNGKARLQVNKVIPYPLALKVLTMLEEGGE